MQNLIALLAVLNLVITAYVLVRVMGLETTARNGAALTEVERAKSLVISIDQIRAGFDKTTVKKYLGMPANPYEREWTYYLDRHSGYVIRFDNQDRVEVVTAWQS